MDFVIELNNVTDKALTFIEKIIKESSKNVFRLISEKKVEDKESRFYELPQHLYAEDGYGTPNYTPYTIVSVELTGTGLVFNGVSTYDEAQETLKSFESNDFSHTFICELANLIDVINSSK